MTREPVPPAGQPAPGERAPRDHAHAVPLARRQHVLLDAAYEQRVRRLLGDEALAAAALRRPLRLDDLLSGERRAAEGADLALPHEVGERAERLVDVGSGLRAVHLVEVDPVGLQAPQAVLHLADDPAARVAALVRVVAHGAVHLGGEYDAVAAALERLTDDLLGLAAAAAAGEIRGDVDPLELLHAVSRLCSPAGADHSGDERMIALLVDGLRYGATSKRDASVSPKKR